MKKFLTVLLVIAVMFTFSFGTAMAAAPTDADDFSVAVNYYKGTTLTYDGNGYLIPDVESKGWDGVVTKTVLEAAIDAWADNVDLTSVDYVTGTGSSSRLTGGAITAMATAIDADVVAAQYDIELAKLNELIASIDLAAYNTTGKTALQSAIETAENHVAALTGGKTVGNTTSVKGEATTLKNAVDTNKANLLSEVTNDLAKTVADLRKTLEDESFSFYVFAKDWFEANSVIVAGEVLAKQTFDADYNAVVAYFEACIDRYESEKAAGKTPFDTAANIKDDIQFYFDDSASTNAPVDANKRFQYINKALDQKDVWVAYYENAAAAAKVAVNPDGTKKYYDVDIDNLLADTKDAIEDDLWAEINAFGSDTWGTAAATKWAELAALANKNYDLQAYRAAATGKFTTGDYALANWVGARADKVEAIQDEYAEKVLLADTVADIDALVKEAKTAIDAIMTKTDVDTVAGKVVSRIKAAGYFTHVSTSTDGKGEASVNMASEAGGLSAYFDVVVGSASTYKAAIKKDALEAAAQVFVDAVLAEENDSITYKQIDEIIAANKDAAYAALKDVKTTTELKAEAAAVADLIKALPTTITIADKEQVLAAQSAMDAYLENAGAAQTDVAKYSTLKSALTTIINAEARDVAKLIRELPLTVTVADAEKIEAARAAYDALDDAYGDYVGTALTSAALPDNTRLEAAEAKLETAKLENAAKLIEALTATSSKAEVEAAKAAFDALKTTSKLTLNNKLYDKLMNAVDGLVAKDITAVESLKIKANTKAYKGYIKLTWTVTGDADAVDGYQIYRSTNYKTGGKLYYTTKRATTRSFKNSSVKKGTKYYYKVRAYKVVDGVTYYSDWSSRGIRTAK